MLRKTLCTQNDLRTIFKSHSFSALLSNGMKKRMKKGAALIKRVAVMAWNQTLRLKKMREIWMNITQDQYNII